MMLNMSMLGNYLQQYQLEYHITDNTSSIRGVRYLVDSRHPRSMEYVYLDKAAGYFLDDRYQDALLLVNGHDQLICWGAEQETLLNDVLSAFEYYNQFELEMHAMTLSHAPLNEMLRRIGQVYPGAVLVCDIDGRLLAACNPETLRPPTLRKSILENNRISSNSLIRTVVDEHGRTCADLSNKPQQLFDPNAKVAYSTVSMYLQQENEHIGMIMMFSNTKEEAWLAKGLEVQLARYCAMAEEFCGSDSTLKANRSIMRSLLLGEPVEAPVLEKLARSLQLETTANLLAFEGPEIRNYTLQSIVAQELGQLSGTGLVCELDGRILLLTKTEQIQNALNTLKIKTPFARYTVGISMPIQSVNLLQTAYKQAVFALERAAGPGVYDCRSLALDYLMQTLAEQDMTLELIHPAIRILKDYDAANHTALLETLRLFLQASCNQADTAKQMSIHLNTLKYRLRRISEIGTVDLRDETDLFYLRLSLRLTGM